MNLRNFIGSSSLILLAWLGVTYFYEVPVERYPTKGKLKSSASVTQNSDESEMVAIAEAEIEESEKY